MSTETGSRSAGESADEYIPLPEYEVSQYFPRQPSFTEEERQQIRDEYGVVRAFFKLRPADHRNLQRWLNQGRIGSTYDTYLERAATYSLAATGVGVLVGILIAVWLDTTGVLSGLSSPVATRGPLVRFVGQNKEIIAGILIALGSAVGIGASTWTAMYYYPRTVVNNRRRNINFMLPHAIVFMYALSYGGMNLLEVFKKLADSEDAYGEVAREFEMIVRDIELFGNDLYTALRNARNLTASENMEQFLDDMVSVLDSGGDVTSFLEDQSETYLDEAVDQQEDFLETLSLMSEVFIVGFVAAPLFLIVILMIISFLGGSSLTILQTLIYFGLPVGMIGFVILISVLSAPYVQPNVTLATTEEPGSGVSVDDLANDERFEEYRKANRWTTLREFASEPLKMIRRDARFSLLVTVPAALLFVVVANVFGTVTITGASAAIRTTVWLVVFPLLIVTVPLSVFHEMNRSRENMLARRFPDTLNILSSANNMGIPFVDALGMVSRWASGALAREMELVRNDIEWNHDTTRALIAFANRMGVSHLSRTIKLIAEGSKSTGDLTRTLSIAAEDSRNRFKIQKKRERAMSSYIAIVVISFLVYLMVIVLLETSYLTPIAKMAEETGGSAGPINLGEVPIDAYRTMFFHSALIQGAGTGLLAGKLSDNRLMTGLKYSILLVSLSVVLFAFI